MAPSREEILKSSTPNLDFLKAASQAGKEPLPSGIDVVTLRQITNAAKAKGRAEQGELAGVREWEIEIPTRDGSMITAWVYGPTEEAAAKELPLFLFFHGGGFCMGNRHDDFQSNRAIALKNQVLVISLDYRLAPEHPFPTAVLDGLDALQWVSANLKKIHKHASLSAGLIVGGTSAGGNLANAVIYLNRDQESPVQVTGQFLSVPNLLPPPVVPEKYRKDYRSMEENKGVSIPPPEIAALFIAAYKPSLESPLFVPFNHPSGHSSIPPTYLQACGLDGLRDDTLIYESVLREEYSIPTRLDLYSGLPHHFWEFFPQLTELVQQRTDDTIKGIRWLLDAGRK